MFKYTKAAIDIVINDIKRYCNIFKWGSMIFTFVYFGYVLYSKSGNFVVNIVLASLFGAYALLDLLTASKEFKSLKKFIRRSYKSLKLLTKAFTLGIMIYGIYTATTNVSAISIILASLMIVLWALQSLFEIIIEIFDDKKDLIVAGWNKDIENLKRPATTVTNFIKKVKGEEIIEEKNCSMREIKILEKKIKQGKEKKVGV
jgi:hypothetical protein